MVIMLSACVSELALRQAVTIVGRGLSVIVVDTLPGARSVASTTRPSPSPGASVGSSAGPSSGG